MTKRFLLATLRFVSASLFLPLFKDRQEAKGKRQEENSSLLPLKAGKRQKARGKFFPIAYCLLPIACY
jgi:hypothetical protein